MTQGITHILKNDTAIQGIVGQNKAGVKYKVYPVVCPQPEEAPYSVVVQTARTPFGQCKGSNDTFEYSFDVVSYHKNFEQVVTLDNAVIDALVGESGLHNGVTFQEIRFENSRDGNFSNEYGLFSRISSFVTVI